MNWTEMVEAQFDRTKVKDRKAREFIRTAPETLFPSLLPEVPPQANASVIHPMPGEMPLFGEEEC